MVSKVVVVLFAVLVLSQAVLSLDPHYFDEEKWNEPWKKLTAPFNITAVSRSVPLYTLNVCQSPTGEMNLRVKFADVAEDQMTNEQQSAGLNYFTDNAEPLMENAQKRSCIRRGGSCDHRRNDCCFSSSCRCNLWGSNCRCHRAGLFQKWG